METFNIGVDFLHSSKTKDVRPIYGKEAFNAIWKKSFYNGYIQGGEKRTV